MKKLLYILLLFAVHATAQPLVNPYRYATAGGGGYDADAQAYINYVNANGGVTLTTTQEGCIDDFVVGKKANSIWTDAHVIYPYIGATANAHKVNLKSPGNFNITWTGTVTHNANGITGDGSSGYGNTGWTSSTNGGSQNSLSVSWYQRTGSISSGAPFGADGNTGIIAIYSSSTVLNWYLNDVQGRNSTFTNHQGMFYINRSTSTALQAARNGGTQSTFSGGAHASDGNLNAALTVLAYTSGGSPVIYGAVNLSYFEISASRSSTAHNANNTLVEALQDCLSRGVQ